MQLPPSAGERWNPLPSLLALLTLSALSALGAPLSAQGLLEDINTTVPAVPPDSAPAALVAADGALWFGAQVPGLGRELCRSDGTPGGTGLVADVYPGSPSSDPAFLVEDAGVVYFAATADDLGREVWRSDGTAAGTFLYADVASGPTTSDPEDLVRAGGLLYFTAITASLGRELWRSDGTPAGTFALTSFPGGTHPNELTPLGSKLLFGLNTSSDVLYVTDGTLVGTVAVPGVPVTGVAELTPIDGQVYFSANLGVERELYRSDGTTIELFADVPGVSSSPSQFASFGGSIFFQAHDASFDYELYKSDGTPAGTTLVKDINPTGNSLPRDLVATDTYLIFTADDGANGREPWRSDGTGAGTQPIGEIVVGAGDGAPTQLVSNGTRVVFAAQTPGGGSEPWTTDGTSIQLLGDLVAGSGSSAPDELVADGGTVWFAATSDGGGREPWSTDGLPGGTHQVADVNPTPLTASSFPRDFVELNGRAFFVADDGVHGEELWVSYGFPGFTAMVLDILPGPLGSEPEDLVVFKDRLYFTADDGNGQFGANRELWSSDGTPGGTTMLANLHPSSSSSPEQLTPTDDFLFFSAIKGDIGREPFVTDGTPGGTVLLGDLYFPNGTLRDSDPELFTQVGDLVYFRATTPQEGSELWSTDGTPGGTQLVLDIDPGFNQSYPQKLTALGDKLVFTAFQAGMGRELWVSEGTGGTTEPLGDLEPGSTGSTPQDLTPVGGRVVFTADTTNEGRELWSTDGTAVGTILLEDHDPGPNDSDPDLFTPFKGGLLYTTDEFNTRSLHFTDGTVPGTQTLFDVPQGLFVTGVLPPIVPAGHIAYFQMDLTAAGDLKLWRTDATPGGTYGIEALDVFSDFTVTEMTPVGGGEEILFQGFEPTNGGELWRSEGDLPQTQLIANLRAGAASSLPQDFTRVGGNILFTADDGDHGRELYSVPIETTGGWAMDPYGFSCPGTGGLRPQIAGGGEARLGGSIDLELSDAKPVAPALLYISGVRAEFPLPGGCVLYFAPPFQFLTAVGTDANGFGSFTLAVPDEAFLLGFPLYFQYFVLDPAGAFQSQLSLTEGLEVVIGPMD